MNEKLLNQVENKYYTGMDIEMSIIFNLRPDVDSTAIRKWAKNVIQVIAGAHGCVKFAFSRNSLDSAQIKLTSWWTTMADWSKFTQSKEWLFILSELRSTFATDINTDIWNFLPMTEEKEVELVVALGD
ncbi:antibiotic biosynthesis monooxygenase [candidate division WOR-3 bacterium]|nr:antibiotic biosynthesis monooxygenase [candidate division WOR-3 bacterium]